MKRIKDILKKYWFYILAFVIPWLVVVIHSWLANTWVTGNGTLLRGDMSAQLVPFYYELWDKIHSGESFAYTWHMFGGIDFHSILGYLISPFTLLVLIFPKDWIENVVQFIMVTKLALVSLSMVYYMYNTKYNTLKIHKGLVSLFLGLAFALGNGMLNFMGYIQFNDVMYCVPILLLLVERMVDNKKWKLYYLILTFCMFSNLYLTYSVCIFLLLWFGFQMMGKVEQRGRKFMLFAGSSVLSALTSAGGICSALVLNYSRYSTEKDSIISGYIYRILVNFSDFVKQFFVLSPIAEADNLAPNIYVSVLGVVLAAFILCIKMNKKEKVYLIILFGLMAASISFGYLSYVWHLFAVPNGVYHRFSNLFVFVILFMMLLTFTHMQDLKKRHVAGIGAVLLVLFFLAFFKIDQYETPAVYIATITLLIIYIILLFFYCKKDISYSRILVVLAVFGIAELCINAQVALKSYDCVSFLKDNKQKQMLRLLEDTTLEPGERVAWSQFTNNMGLIAGINTDGGFASGINGQNREFHQRLGMACMGRVGYLTSGGSPLINLLFNNRYGISDSDTEYSDARIVSQTEDYKLYRMNRLAGLGYMVNSDVLQWDIDKGTYFDVQNQFVEYATGEAPIFHAEKVEMTYENGGNDTVSVWDKELEQYGTYAVKYQYKYDDSRDMLKAEFTVDEEMDLYLSSEINGNGEAVSVFLDGEMLFTNERASSQWSYHIGNVRKGQKVSVYVLPEYELNGQGGFDWVLQLASFDEEAYAKAYEKLSQNTYHIESETSDYLCGTIEAKEAGVMMTSIQAADGFSVIVDGKKSDYVTIAGAMIGVSLPKGKHNIEFVYDTPEIKYGKLISVFSIALFLLLCFYDYGLALSKSETGMEKLWKIKKVINQYGIYILAFLIPWMILLLRCFYDGIWLFGDGSLLRGDMSAQLVPFYYELWNKVHAGEALSFTWNVGGGTDFHTLSGYLISPFTLLVLVLPKTWIPNVVQFIMGMKWALVTVSMVYFFKNTRYNTLHRHKGMVSLFLGIAYGMGTGMLNYMGYIQFEDVMICFPVLLLLVEKIAMEKRWKLYYLLLTFSMLSNIYISFSVCIFLLMWFVFQLLSEKKERAGKFFLFAGVSLLSALTVFNSLIGGLILAQGRLDVAQESTLLSYLQGMLIKPYDFIKQMFALTPIASAASYDPNIYFSVLAAVLAGAFLFIKMDKKKKLYLIGVTLVLTVSFFYGPLSLVWHCFAVPNAVYHRFSYLFVFVMLFLVLLVLIHLKELRLRQICAVGTADGVLFIITFLLLDRFESYIVYLVTILLIVLTMILLYLFRKKHITYSQILLAVSVIGILEMCSSAFVALNDYNVEGYYNKQGNQQAVTLAEKAVMEDGERMEYMDCSLNMGLVTSKASDSAFLSSINGYKMRMHKQLGMPYNGEVEYSYYGASPLVNLLSNIRYYVATGACQVSDADEVETTNGYTLYRTRRLAGLGYMVDEQITDWNTDFSVGFDVQNDFVKKAVGGTEIFDLIEQPQLSCYTAGGEKVEEDPRWAEKGVYRYDYKMKYGNEQDTMIAEYKVTEDIDDLYMAEIANWGAYINIFVDGELIRSDLTINVQQMFHIGKINKGQTLTICAVPVPSIFTVPEGILVLEFAKFNEDAYAAAYEKLSSNVYQIETQEADYVKGSIEAEQSGIMMTSIQALDGFTVYVDGKETQCVKVADALLGVPLEKGKHTVEFKYRTPSPLYGKVISVGAFVLYVIFCLIDDRKKRKKNGSIL